MAESRPKLLFLMADSSDYLGDGVLHGVRQLLGERAVDFPKRESLYVTCPRSELDRLHGRGYTLYGRLPDIPIPRLLTIDERVIHQFSLVAISSIQSCFGWFVQLSQVVPPEKLVILDGSDWPHSYPHCSYWLRYWRYWFLPQVSTRTLYFKRELTPDTNWYRYYKLLPRGVAGRLRFPPNFRTISFSIPEEWVVDSVPPKTQRFTRHVVDSDVAVAVGGSTDYPFTREEDYIADLRTSAFGVTMRRAGWE